MQISSRTKKIFATRVEFGRVQTPKVSASNRQQATSDKNSFCNLRTPKGLRRGEKPGGIRQDVARSGEKQGFNTISVLCVDLFQAGVFICLLEIGFPFFIWSDKPRKILAHLYLCNARRNRVNDRNVPFALIMIIPNVAAFGPGVIRAERERISLRAPGSCLVKLLDRGKMRSQDRPTLPFCLCHAYLLSTTATGIAKIHKG